MSLPTPDLLRKARIKYAEALREKDVREARARQSNSQGGLLEFIRYFWHVLEPVDPLVEGWPLECLCAHLEAITRGETIEIDGKERPFNRFLANVPPGFQKSLVVNVWWPAFEWGPMGMPHLRYVAFSYASDLTERDNAKFRDLVCSQAYRELWGHVFTVVGDGKIRVTNDKTGFKFASSLLGVGTGERGHRILADDLNKIKGSHETEESRESVSVWAREAMQNRLNDLQRDVIVAIQQRTHERDVSGSLMEHLGSDYCHLIIPMEYEDGRHFSHYTGWNEGQDPRSRDGELAWAERYPADTLASFKRNSYLWAGQYQQRPTPRGGGLIKEEWWQIHEVSPKFATQVVGGVQRNVITGYKFTPEFTPRFVLASLDTAFSEKEENDYSALTVWAVHDHSQTKHRAILLVDAWQKRLPHLHGEMVERLAGESPGAYRRRAKEKWGLVEWVAETCKLRKVDRLVIENKNRGPDVVKEIKRLYSDQDWSVQALDVRGDKWSRGHAIVDLFTDGMIFAPAEIKENGAVWYLEWAKTAIEEISGFPRSAHDDLFDSMTLALQNLRTTGWAIRKDEKRASDIARSTFKGNKRPALYDV